MRSKWLGYTLVVVLSAIVLGASFQGLISVTSDVYFDGMNALIAKSWKEILLGIASLLTLGALIRTKHWSILKKPFVYVSGAYAALHVIYIICYSNGLLPSVSGLLIDLRYVLYLVLAYIAICLYPQYRRLMFVSAGLGAVAVLGFALIQLILPADFLSVFGYSSTTISPYLTVDLNDNFVRLQSWLRGPNPLGAYGLIVFALSGAYILHAWAHNIKRDRRYVYSAVALSFVSLCAIWFSYSRSALGGAVIVGIGLALYYGYVRIGKRSIAYSSVGVAILMVLAGLVYVSPIGSIVISHEDPLEGNTVNSNDGHALSLQEGVLRFIREPLGFGVGSTGSASLLSDKPYIVENQYLYIAHETGWLGLLLFMLLFWFVMRELWRHKDGWLSAGLFAAGIGLAAIGILLPVWADDTIALIWWGLAGVALAKGYTKK